MNGVSLVSRFLLITRYGVAGGSAALVNVLVLYGCTEYLHLHYLYDQYLSLILPVACLTWEFEVEK